MMKFVSLNRKNKELLNISAPHKGMNLTKPTVHLSEGTTGMCKNMIYDGGVLKTRKGLKTDFSNILDIGIMSDGYNYEFFGTETEVFHNGENKRIAAIKVEYDISHQFIMVYLIGENGGNENIGYIHFMRVDDTTFYVPQNVVFYSGKPQMGGGLFAFVTLKNLYDESKEEYIIYEISENWDNWSRAYSYYTPTVYINGRGDAYEEARANDFVSAFTPRTLEAPNMLYNRYFAYFTSDGYSSSFRLPFTGLSSSNLVCRINTSPTEYTEWEIMPGKTQATQSFRGATVEFNIDRQTGTFFFTSNGGSYSIPVFSNYKNNNIRVFAQMDYSISYDSVVSCTVSETVGSTILFSGGKDKNKIFYTNYDNPLYFPKIEDNEIGSADEEVKHFYRDSDTVFAFKDNKIYSVKLSGGSAINSTALLADNGETFYEKINFKVQCINDRIGTVRKETVCVINGKLIWQGIDSKVYICGASDTVMCISDPIEPITKEYGDQNRFFATVWQNKYILIFGNRTLVFDFRNPKNVLDNESISRYYWVFPTEVEFSGCMNIGGNLCFLCRMPNNYICYTATLDSANDTVILSDWRKETRKIPSFVRFKSYYLGDGSAKSNIHTAFLQMSLSGKTKIKIGEGVNSEEFTLKRKGFSTGGYDSIKLMPDLFSVDLVEITVDSEDAFVFSNADVYYSKTNF